MTIRITDCVKPGYERVALGEVGATPAEGIGLVGSPVMNQAQAAIRNQASIASIPPSLSPAGWVQRVLPLVDNGRARSDFASISFLPDYDLAGSLYPKAHVAYGNGVYVYLAMSTKEKFCTAWISTDAVNWTRAGTLPTVTGGYPNPYNQLIFANGLFVAVGGDPESAGGRVLTSPDGITWTKRTSASYNIAGVAYGNGKFVAIGKSGVGTSVLTSPDGLTWTWQTTTGLTGTPVWANIRFLNGYFFASRADNAYVCRSTDGLAWTQVATGGPYVTDMAFNGSSLIVGTGQYYARSSDNGASWSYGNPTPGAAIFFNEVAFGAGVFVGVHPSSRGGDIYTSTDGITWVKRTAPVSDWSSVVYTNGRFLVAGTDAPQVMTSTDGITWVTAMNHPRGLTAIAYGAGLFVAVAGTGGNQRVITSPDGLVWTKRTTPLDALGDAWWSAICWSGTQFVAAASSSGSSNTARIMTSPDGINWTMRNMTNDPGLLAVAVVYGGGVYLIVRTQTANFQRSTDGVTWATADNSGLGSYSYSGAAYGNGKFVVVAGSGNTWTSPDGLTWSGPVMAGHPWTSVTFGNGLFVAVASDGTMAYSDDGVAWHSVSLAGSWRSVAFCGNAYVAVGQNAGSQCVATSTDGAVWEKGTTQATPNRWCGVAGDGVDKAVAVADDCAANGLYPIMTSRTDGVTVAARYWRFAGTGYSIAYEIEIKDAAGTNHALATAGASATASDYLQAGTEPSKAIDGISNADSNKWASLNNGSPHWIEIDLGQVRDIASIRIVPRNTVDGINGWETQPIVITAGNAPAPATVVKTLVPRIDFPYGTTSPIVAALSATSTT